MQIQPIDQLSIHNGKIGVDQHRLHRAYAVGKRLVGLRLVVVVAVVAPQFYAFLTFVGCSTNRQFRTRKICHCVMAG